VGVIVFHAGMSKAGSTNIQEWLAENLSLVRSRGIEPMRIVQPSQTGPIALVPSTRSNVISKSPSAARDPATRAEVVRVICEELDAHASQTEMLVISSESYEIFFNNAHAARGDDATSVLGHLDALARAHSVRVAYYVRPQHSWLESAWRQWGFRDPRAPDAWLRAQRSRLEYLQILHEIRRIAPHLSFEMRPFRADLLEGGDVVSDFARAFLGLGDVPPAVTEERWSNRGIPLEVAILLRDAPQGMFWSDMHDNRNFYPLKKLVLQWNLPKTEAAVHSRAVLQRYAYTTFESDNLELIKEFGWNTEHFVAPVEDAQGAADADTDIGLAELNGLWKSAASDAERRILFHALQRLLSQSSAMS
jgi:hypothetical protein